MALITTASSDLELQAVDGSWIPLMLEARTDREGNSLPKTIETILASTNVDSPLSSELHTQVIESWFRGVGLDYDFAPGVDTTDPDYACPAGAATDVTLPGTPNLHGAIIGFEEYGGNLYVAQQGTAGVGGGGRVCSLAGGSAAPALASPVGAPFPLPDGEYVRGMQVADNGAGTTLLYVFSSDGGIQNGRIHSWNGAAWVSTAAALFGTNGRGFARTIYWRDRSGIGAPRTVTVSHPKKISYTKPNADPMLAASWVEGVRIGTAYELRDLAVSRGHLYCGAKDNLFDLDEVGNSPGITSYISEQVQPGNGDAVQYLDGAVYYAFGRGLLKVNVEQQGLLEEQPGQCAPGAYLPVEGCPRGYVTAMTTDQGWLVASVFDTTTRTSSVFYGKSRETLGIESPNPLIWHGPMLYFLSDYKVSRMRTSALAGDLRLWVASIGDNTGTVRLSWMSRPLAGTALQDQRAGGAHRVTTGNANGTMQPYSRMYGLRRTWDDKAARKDLHQHVVGTRGTNPAVGSQITIYNRADAAPGSTAWGTGVDITTGPVQTVTPSTTTVGYSLEQRIDFVANSGGATPPLFPYLDSIRNTAWKIAPVSNVHAISVEYGDGVTNLQNGYDAAFSPDQITAQLEALAGQRTVMRDRNDNRRTVRVRQVLNRVETLGEGQYGKRVLAQLQIHDLGAA
jgi:hypothetical protein